MEDEAFFLHAVCRPEPIQTRVENGKTIHEYIPTIRRVALKRPERGAQRDLIYTRICVDFDGLIEQIAYVVVLTAKVEGGAEVVIDKFHFPTIKKTLVEAEVVKDTIEKGGYKDFLEKGQKFHKVEIVPTTISEF